MPTESLQGWFSISRRLLESDLWKDEKFSRGQAWVDLIGLARFRDGHARIRGSRVNVARGEIARSEAGLAVRWKWSRGKVRRFLNELENDQQIVQRKSSVTTIIQVVNYELYQSAGTTDRQSTGQQTDIRQDNRRTSDGTRKNKGNKGNKENHLPLTPSSDQETPPDPWGGLEEDLFSLEVSQARAAISSAQQFGCSPELVRACIEHYRSKQPAWGSGALYNRIVQLRPTQSHAELWPMPTIEVQQQQRREAESEKFKALHQGRRKIQDEKAKAQARYEALESAHGTQLDGMDREQIAKLIKQAEPVHPEIHLKRYARSGLTKTLRLLLLDHLDGAGASEKAEAAHAS